MRCTNLKGLALTFLVLPLTAATTRAQTAAPDTSTLRARVMESAVVDTATVIALVPDRAPARPDSALKTARAVASRFGYVLQVLLAGQLQRIVDRRHVAVYQVPKTFRAGYIIIVPSRRPRFVQGFFGADRLAREIGEYEQLVHRLTLR